MAPSGPPDLEARGRDRLVGVGGLAGYKEYESLWVCGCMGRWQGQLRLRLLARVHLLSAHVYVR